ncbi:hypothetical protein BD324DRAFT_651022 [Kockovaella imperatae]|uniref:OTU domain-containing protein n=1 Tax=Kockovaella imperatae TaxID=4999 RepID=A0A1Y1UH98_9TREE|nr:hypothetical protein BD324DRAFT_651022 [Kockovaella imperatae]ORX37428.1 hypothetical protein BD324DRAFT_651022 [Kockovaella imperatae]
MDIQSPPEAEAGPSRLRRSQPSTRPLIVSDYHSYHHPYIGPLIGGGNHKRNTHHAKRNARPKQHLQLTPSGDPTPALGSGTASSSSRRSAGTKTSKGGGGTNGRKRVTRAQARARGSSSPMTDLEAIALEDAAVKGEISRLGLGLRDVQGDGNCLFRALADQLWGVARRHGEVRKLVCDYLETNKDGMEAFVWPFLKEGEDYQGYVERMRQLSQFGSHIEIQAAARVFRRNIRVVMSTTSFTIPWQTETESHQTPRPDQSMEEDYFTIPRPRTRSSTTNLLMTPALPPPSTPSYAKTLAEYIPSIRPGRSMLWLALFSQAEHFQSIRRKGDGDSGPAEIEDRLAIPHEKDQSEAARRQRGEVVEGPSQGSSSIASGGSSVVSQVLASLPAGHGVSEDRASGILARVKGDLGEAVELLLEELRLEGSDPEQHGQGTTSSSDGGSSPTTASSSNPTSPSEQADDQVKPPLQNVSSGGRGPIRGTSHRGNGGARGRVRGRPVAVAVV